MVITTKAIRRSLQKQLRDLKKYQLTYGNKRWTIRTENQIKKLLIENKKLMNYV